MKTYEQLIDTRPKKYKNKIFGIIIIILFIWSFLAINFQEISQAGLNISLNILKGIFTPSLDLIFSINSQSVIFLTIQTVFIAFLGTLLGSFIAFFLAIIGANNLNSKYLYKPIRFILNIIRTIPALVYGLMVIKISGPGPFAGVLTFTLVSIGMVAKLYIEDIEDIDKNLLEVKAVAGLNYLQNIRLIIIPEIFSGLISNYLYRFDINVREAAILGLIGGGGLGTPLILAMSEQRFSDVGAYLLGLILLVLLVEYISTKIRFKISNG